MKIRMRWLIGFSAVVALTVGGRALRGGPEPRVNEIQTGGQPRQLMPGMEAAPVLPDRKAAKGLLNTTPRHREWVVVPVGSEKVFAFLVYPERSDRAPVVVVTGRGQGASDWVRAVADQVAAGGFMAIVPDVLTGRGPKGGDTESFRSPEAVDQALANLGSAQIARRTEAVRAYATALPAANGLSAALDLSEAAGIAASAAGGSGKTVSASFPLNSQGWNDALSFLKSQTHDHPVFAANDDEHAMHFRMLAQVRSTSGEVGQPGQPGGDTSFARKRPDLPADFYTAKSTMASSKLRKEWVDLPIGDVKVHTWLEYPAGNGKAGIVVVMQYGTGMDIWVRALADQLAQSGFIAIAPDIWSGTGAGGGGLDSFEFLDDAIKAGARVTPDETMQRFKAARDYALKLPRSNGKTASIGFCAGGGNSFRFAGDVPELNGAVVYYGTPPDEAIMARINSPVIAFYGENDARVTSTAEPTIANMKRLGKSFEPHIYPKATHSFALFQEVAGNPAAINDAWPRTIAFLKKQLM